MTGKTRIGMTLKEEVAGAANLMAHPFAGAAAMTALGFGMAGQAMGVWIGMLEGASEMTRRLSNLQPAGLAKPASEEPAKPAKDTASAQSKARATVKTMMDDSRAVAERVAARRPKVAGSAADVVVAEPVAAFVQPQALEKPEAPDDLKAISGIGPKLEQVLNGLGIWTYAQIAAWSEEEIGWVDEHLSFGGRIGRDDWTGQASKLATGN
ncbi:NADH-ubiquinone dehydrogenase [Oryzicola mucosus]|uniref:NADH-ubiquinone dehydrogenase n=1 Tax=Oryzicola mucosus TaxID=2767425 RepID=A0A8J6PT71_9HYPH|nr:NADH-ubiquinone dehydrogenase [Oryzicola mucosus]MBD0414824.1 NADH-ubiquinone dehydrogenase [Oryzicola mucosus]